MDSNVDERDAAIKAFLNNNDSPWQRLWWDVADND